MGQKLYQLTEPQKRELITEKMFPHTGFANCPFTIELDKNAALELLEKALHHAIKRHEGMRARIVFGDGGYNQYIAGFAPKEFEFFDFSTGISQEKYELWLKKEVQKPLKILDADLYYIALLRFPSGNIGFYINCHHLIADAFCMKALISEVIQNYRNLAANGAPMAAEAPSFLEYLATEAAYLKGGEAEKDKAFFNGKFATLPPEIILPYTKPAHSAIKADTCSLVFSPDLYAKLKVYAQSQAISEFSIMVSAILAYLAKVTRNDDIALGMLTHNRKTVREKAMFGMLCNLMPLRTAVGGDASRRDFMNSTALLLRDLLKNHGRYPFSRMAADLRKQHDNAVASLLNVIIVGLDLEFDDAKVTYHHPQYEQPPYHLIINVIKKAEECLELSLTWPDGMFAPHEIERLAQHLFTIVEDMITHPERDIASLPVAAAWEKSEVLKGFNATGRSFPGGKSVIDLFEDQAARVPDKVAVVFETSQVTYQELNEDANSLASALIGRGVGRNDVIAILMDQRIEMITGILAILKTGAAYLPMDHSYPTDRITFMVEQSGAKYLLSAAALFDKIANKALFIDITAKTSQASRLVNPLREYQPTDLCYIIYTSGSTGKPKGVMLEHGGLCNFIAGMEGQLTLSDQDNCAKYAGYAFDASVMEIFLPLVAGASLHIIAPDTRLSPKMVNDYFNEHNITVAFLPTQFAEQFMEFEENRSLRALLTGGDKLKRFRPRPYQLLNIYGPTECTIAATLGKVESFTDNIPIGQPLPNYKVYILDKAGNLMPVGIPGELCIGGAGVGRGYWRDEEKTAKAFCRDPFNPGGRMYRTGDLARWLATGELEFLGRIDFQVKIRGFRIEIGEIETQMLRFAGVCEAVVVDRTSFSQEKYLVGFFVAAFSISPETFKEFLKKSLPDYMVPAFVVQLDQMPLNASGKIDRNALPEVRMSSDIVGPNNAIEAKLIDIWKDILGLAEVSITADFFNSGGDSLTATLVLSKIEKEFALTISFKNFFKNPTIQKIAAMIQDAGRVHHKPIEKSAATQVYPATSAQKRLFTVEKIEGASSAYNIPLMFVLTGPLDTAKLGAAIDTIIQRHEALRTSLDIMDDEVVQIIHDDLKIKRKYYEIAEDALSPLLDDLVKPFALHRAPLFRIALIKLSPLKHILFWDIHHVICDGSSMVLILHELAALYSGKKPKDLFIQYKDFALYQKELALTPAFKRQEAFWQELLAGELPLTDLPADFHRPPIADFRGDQYHLVIDKTLTGKLHAFARANSVTLNMVFSAAFSVFVGKYCQAEDIITGMGSSGRHHLDTQNLVGMFVNTLPFRSRPAHDKTFRKFLEEIRDNLLDLFDNQDVPFEEIVRIAGPKRDMSRHPLFNVGMVFQSMGFPHVELGALAIKPLVHYPKVAKFDQLLEVVEMGETIEICWQYRTSLFQAQSIARMALHFRNLLEAVVMNPLATIGEIGYLSELEEKSLLYAFNQTAAQVPCAKCVHQLFAETAASCPERIAITYMGQHLTYRELDQLSTRLAFLLRKKGVVRESIVAMLLDISPQMIIGMLAVLKAGGCYLPLKPEFPPERLQFMLKDSGARHLLTSSGHRAALGDFAGEFIDVFDEALDRASDAELPNINQPGDMMYIIYTSGSTGEPKGVMIEHRNVVSLMKNSRFPYEISASDVWSMFHSYCFDFSVWEIYGALLYGGRLLMVPKEIILSPAAFVALVKQEGVTVLSQTPGAFYNFIAEELKRSDRDLALRYVTFGGEALQPVMIKEWRRKYPKTRLVNMYGITETTVHVTFKEITDDDIEHNISNIGLPLPTLRTYIMDSKLRLLPVGVAGELCVAGDGLARGYLGHEELTREKFVPNPYIPGERVYRSGDLARRLANGEMEYLGRIDSQVKIRGFRIELGEIASQLLKHPFIDKAVVIAKGVALNENYLVAYYVAAQGIHLQELKPFLAALLPEYMIPAYFVRLEAIPLNANGKVDRSKLPDEKALIDTGNAFVSTKGRSEEIIFRAWQKVLRLQRISTLDNFFDIGGDSLSAVSLTMELEKDFLVAVNDIFKWPTIAALAKNLKGKTRKGIQKLEILQSVELADDLVALPRGGEPAAFKAAKVADKLASYREEVAEIRSLDYSQTADYRHILLTGATGYLGAYLLCEILQETNAIITAIVRGRDAGEASARLKDNVEHYFGAHFLPGFPGRLTVLNGDLSEPCLGLDAIIYKNLAHSVDAILNSAANTKHFGDYAEFSRTNVDSVANLIVFAGEGRKKALHHISTMSVAMGLIDSDAQALFTENDLDIGQRCDNVYVTTKLAAERRIFAARNEGANINIYRVGNITFDTKSGAIQRNVEDNAFFQQVRAFVNTGLIPDKYDAIDLSFVDCLAKAIIKLMFVKSLINNNYHLYHPSSQKLSHTLADAAFGLHIKTISFADFIGFIIKDFGRNGAREYIQNYLLHTGLAAFDEDALKAKSTEVLFTAEKSLAILERLGFCWPELDPVKMVPFVRRALADRVDFFADQEIFKHLDEKMIYAAAAMATPFYGANEENVLWEGSCNDRIYFIADGHIEISKHSTMGWLGTIAVLGKYEYFGEECLLDGNATAHSADAILGDITLYSFDKAQFAALIHQRQELSLSLIRSLIQAKSNLQNLFLNM